MRDLSRTPQHESCKKVGRFRRKRRGRLSTFAKASVDRGEPSLPKKEVSFIMRPHTNHFDGFDVIEHLIDQPMLNVDTPGAGSGKITR